MVIAFADVKSWPSYLYGVIGVAVHVILVIVAVTVIVMRKRLNIAKDENSQDEGTMGLLS